MVTITKAWTQRGWSSTDHMIDDSRLAEVVGVSYRSVEHARRAAAARADKRGFVSFQYTLDGRLYEYDDSPSGIPGRTVDRIREVAP
jgi:hypothetical protein